MTGAKAGERCDPSGPMGAKRTAIELVALLLCGVLSTGCVPDTIKVWEGKPRSLLLEAWGTPARETRTADGWTNTIYLFEYVDAYDGANLCEVAFDSDPGGTIRTILWHGNCLEMPRL